MADEPHPVVHALQAMRVGRRILVSGKDFVESLDIYHQDAQHGESAQQIERQGALAFHYRAGVGVTSSWRSMESSFSFNSLSAAGWLPRELASSFSRARNC